MSTAQQDKILKNSLWATLINSSVAVIFRGITFILNAFILRRISAHILGVINVRLLLLVDTILFISREAFRRACLKKPENGDWKGTINLVWMCVPLGIIWSFIWGSFWIYQLELEDQELQIQYRYSVILVCLSALIELCCEPFFVVGQIFMWIKFRAIIDMIALGIRAALLFLIVTLYPEQTILLFGCAYLFSTVMQLILYIVKFATVFKQSNDLEPLKSVVDLFPSRDLHMDPERRVLASSFFCQGVFKQLLTDGEKYLFTWFSLMTLAEQGIYDVIANLGSLAPRLVFSKVEEAAYLYFNQTVHRGQKMDSKVNQKLFMYLRYMTLFGLTVLIFGYSYSHLLLHIYGGSNLSSGIGLILLRAHCVFVFFMALNGVSECYSFAIMTNVQVNDYNYIMSGMTLVFLFCAWVLATIFGPVGFIMANCCNFAMRIIHSCYVIQKHDGAEALKGFIPTYPTIICLILSGIICQISETMIYDPSDLKLIFVHLIIGGLCFITMVSVMFLYEYKPVKSHED